MYKIRIYPLILGAVIAAIFVAGKTGGVLQSWESKVSDALLVGQAPPADIAIVAIDNQSIQGLGVWPWPRGSHAKIISRLTDLGARAIGYDVNFPETQNEKEDEQLERAIVSSGKVVLPFEAQLDLKKQPPLATELLSPLPRFAKGARLGLANTPPDSDGVLRRVPLEVQTERGEKKKAFFIQILETAGFRPAAREGALIIDFAGPARTFKIYSAAELLSGALPRKAVEGKIVLVGATAPDLHDQVTTPTAKAELMSGVEAQANAVSSGRSGGLRETPLPLEAMTIILVALMAVFIPLRARRTRTAIILSALILLTLSVAALFLAELKIIFPVFYPALAVASGAGAATTARLAREKREKSQLKTTLSRYLSPQVVEYLLRHPEKITLGGEKREMSVLFSDLRGFTSLSEKMKPEQLVAVLNTYLTEMTAIVFTNRGVLDKYMGDAVMAFWNAPLDDPGHAESAVRSAIEMRDRLREMNATGAFPEGVELRLGVGVNSGPMVVGNMGGAERFDYTVMGDAVNLGSRLESLNKEYGTEIIVSETTAAKLTSGILLRPLDLVAVKGKKEPVEIFEAVGLVDAEKPETIQLAADFVAARELYKEKKWREAQADFAALAQKFPADQATKNYLERCRTFEAAPPPADWNGVWVMTKK